MGKIQTELKTSYRPIPYKKRFWIHAENCYTEEDLNFRDWVIKQRSNSGIHPDYLANPSSWFAEDSQALINVNEKAWFYSGAFKTRHLLTRDDFHVQPVDSQRLQWPALFNLMQNVGDYLLIRNELLPDEHLNQPMNFVLLDINHMLKGLSQNPNIAQVKEQLAMVNHYIRTIEKKISPMVGSDRLFFAHFRGIIDEKIEPQLSHLIESQRLIERLRDLSKGIKHLSTERNRILHFALNVSPVNPHPYEFMLSDSSVLVDSSDRAAYPTQAAKACGQPSTDISTELHDALQLSVKDLHQCPHFRLIAMNDEILADYAKAISDLNELHRFEAVIANTINLLEQAGEVYTVYQFDIEMLKLLKAIDTFISDSALPIHNIIKANTQAYHHAIVTQQNLSVWKQWFSDEKDRLQTFIKNQDALSQFPSSVADLAKTNNELKQQVNLVINHLLKPKTQETRFEMIAEQMQELNKLLSSMRGFHQLTSQEVVDRQTPSLSQAEPEKQLLGTLENPLLATLIKKDSLNTSTSELYHPRLFKPLAPPPGCSDPNHCENQTVRASATLQLMSYWYLLIPLSLIVLYLLLPKKKEMVMVTNKTDYQDLKVKFEDLITKANGLGEEDQPECLQSYLREFQELQRKAQRGIYEVEQLQNLCNEIEDELAINTNAPI